MVKNIYFDDFLLQIVLILIRLNRDRLISKWQSGLNLVAYCKVIKKEVEERTVETIVKINEVVNGIVWGVPIMLLILGSVFVCMRYGIARGIYSNEADLYGILTVECLFYNDN